MLTFSRSALARAALAIGIVLAGAGTTAGQETTMRDIVDLLVTNQSVQTGDFVKDRAAADAASAALSQALLVSLSTLPTSASSAGFTYRFNPSLGTLERTTTSFGPSFVERAVTSGRGRMALGATWQYGRFTRLDGRDLDDGTLVTTANRFLDEPAAFDVETLALELSSSIITGFATVGVTDRFDVAIAVPYVQLDLEGERVDTYRGAAFTQAAATASTSGFGDVALRGKFALLDRGPGRLAAVGEFRLPTGREEDLLGAGQRATRVLAVGSFEGEAVAVHGNIGWSWGGVADEFSYAGAITMATSPRVTVSAELFGRHLGDVGRIGEIAAPHPLISGVETVRLAAESLGLHVVTAGASFKWNVGGPYLLKGSVLVPATDAGLTSRLRITLGIDYAFGG